METKLASQEEEQMKLDGGCDPFSPIPAAGDHSALMPSAMARRGGAMLSSRMLAEEDASASSSSSLEVAMAASDIDSFDFFLFM